MVVIGEQLQLARRLATTLQTYRPSVLTAWLRRLREIPRDFGGARPVAHLEEFAPTVFDALLAYLARGDSASALVEIVEVPQLHPEKSRLK